MDPAAVTDDDHRRRRESAAVIAALWLLGGSLTLLTTLAVPGYGAMPHRWLVLAVCGVAFAQALGLHLSRRRPAPPARWLLEASVASGSLAVALIVVGGGAQVAAAWGGFYGFVTAAAFLSFPFRRAVAQLAFAGVAYAAALTAVGWPGGAATWLMVIGIAAGGAGMVGHLVARAEERSHLEALAAQELQEVERTRRTFLQAVSHEIRTPLTGVLGFATLLERRGRYLPEDMVQLLHERLHAQAMRLDRLMTDLLDVERLSRGGVMARREPTRADYCVEAATSQVEVGDLSLVHGVDPVTIMIEPSKLERIVVNLVSNAVKHAKGATTIWAHGRLVEDTFVLAIEDDGPGVPDRDRDRVLEAFVQGAHTEGLANPGTGIGLAVVARFTEIHGGTVHVEDRPGGGARFVVSIPGARVRPGDLRRPVEPGRPELADDDEGVTTAAS